MARDHTRVNIDIWGDDEFRELPVDAQALYWMLWTSPDRTYCGAHEWRPGKLTQTAGDWTVPRLLTAGAVLSERLFLIIDEVTEECLIRSWIKHDGLWRMPNMAVTMANARAALASKKLRGVIVHEVKKLVAAEPDHGGWKRDEVKKMLAQKPIDPASLEPFDPGPNRGINPALNPSHNPSFNPPAKGYGHPGANPPSNPAPTTATATSYLATATEGGYVTGVRHLAAVPSRAIPPIPRCPDHVNDPAPPKCGACADARRFRNEWDIAQAAARAQAITDCPDCDEDGWAPDEDGAPTIRCTHARTEARHA